MSNFLTSITTGISSLFATEEDVYIEQWRLSKESKTKFEIPELDGDKLLLFAIKNRYEKLLQQFLKDKVSPFKGGNEELVLAATLSSDAMLTSLVKSGININVSGKGGNTCLHHSILQKNIPMIKTILDLGAKPNIGNRCKRTAIRTAIELNDIDIVKLFIERLPNLDINVAYFSRSKEMYDTITETLQKTPDYNQEVLNSWLMYHVTNINSRRDAVDLFIKLGADVNAIVDGEIIFRRALIRNPSIEILTHLLETGANPRKKNPKGLSGLMIFTDHVKDEEYECDGVVNKPYRLNKGNSVTYIPTYVINEEAENLCKNWIVLEK